MEVQRSSTWRFSSLRWWLLPRRGKDRWERLQCRWGGSSPSTRDHLPKQCREGPPRCLEYRITLHRRLIQCNATKTLSKSTNGTVECRSVGTTSTTMNGSGSLECPSPVCSTPIRVRRQGTPLTADLTVWKRRKLQRRSTPDTITNQHHMIWQGACGTLTRRHQRHHRSWPISTWTPLWRRSRVTSVMGYLPVGYQNSLRSRSTSHLNAITFQLCYVQRTPMITFTLQWKRR